MPTVDRRRPRSARVGIGVAAVGVIAIVLIAGQVARPTKVSPNGDSGASLASTDPTAGPGRVVADAFPAIDRVPWTAIDWRQVPNAFGKKVDPALNRIDGLMPGGPGLMGWGRTSQPGRNQFNDMGAVQLSTGAAAWAVVPLDAGVGRRDASEIHLVASGPAGIVIFGDVCCTDEERPALWRSADGRVRQRLPFPGAIGPAAGLSRVVATADRYVVGGGSKGIATIWTSKDGATWTAVDGAAAGFGPGLIADIARTPVGLVAVGHLDVGGTYDGAVWTSADGEAWTRIAANLLVGPDDTIVERVVPWAGGWLLIGQEGPHADRVRCEQLGQAGQLASIDGPVDGGGPAPNFSCGWGTEVHWLTADGSAWQRVAPAGLQGGVPKRGDLIEFRLVAAGGPGLVVLGEGSDVGAASIFVSADGINWQPTAPDRQIPSGIVPYGFVIGGRTIAAVADGPSAWIGTAR